MEVIIKSSAASSQVAVMFIQLRGVLFCCNDLKI